MVQVPVVARGGAIGGERLPRRELLSVVCPALDEGAGIAAVCAEILALDLPLELLVVDDGSRDDTAERALAAGATVLRHARTRGNGAAVKTGLCAARGEIIVIVDADGQHDPSAIPLLVKHLREGADLAVGCRPSYRESGLLRGLGNRVLAALASRVAGTRIPDLTSGFRAFHRARMEPFVPLLPDGFSTPATSTLAFLLAGLEVRFEFVSPRRRRAGSETHTHLLTDGLRFLVIVARVAAARWRLRVPGA